MITLCLITKETMEWDGFFVTTEPRILIFVVEVKQHITKKEINDVVRRFE